MKHALITGITGQDGSFLAEHLLEQGYRVFGFARRESWVRPHCASHLAGRVEILHGDITDGAEVAAAVRHAQPDEIYNLASQSLPRESWSRGDETLLVNGLGATRVFEAVRQHAPRSRVYQASSSEMFGRTVRSPQDEATAFDPVNPYAASKLYAHQMARIYREAYGLHVSCGILFNHESERRPLQFLTQKVAYGAACASLVIANSPDLDELGRPIVRGGKLSLGNLEVARDWGYAGDFVRAMWLMLQREQPGDYVVGTGKLHTVHQLCEVAYASVGRDWRECVVGDPALARPLETGQTLADPRKARAELGWEPAVGFERMIEMMVAAHVERFTKRNPIRGMR